jgi:TetR/AcrR family transcriptional regulator, transcriptional repressor for nem operon
MRYASEHKQMTRDKVLEAATGAIRRDGIANIGVASIMKEVGLTHGGFYAHFSSRDALVAAAIEAMIQEAHGRFLGYTDGKSPADALGAYVDYYLSPAHRDLLISSCPLPVLSADMPRLQPISRRRFTGAIEGLAGLLRPLLAALGHKDPISLSQSVVSEAVGAVALARAIGASPQSDAILDASRTAIKRRIGLTSGKGALE